MFLVLVLGTNEYPKHAFVEKDCEVNGDFIVNGENADCVVNGTARSN